MTIDYIKEVVTKAGGIYVGIDYLTHPLVLFNDPKSKSTLALRMEDVSIESVVAKLRCQELAK